MRKKIVILFAFLPVLMFGQLKNKNVFYLELLGKAGLYSLNYERYFLENGFFKMGFRAGVSYIGSSSYDFVALPYGLQMLFGQKKGHFEISVGQSFAFISENAFLNSRSNNVFGFDNNISFGYKKLPLGKEGFVFGAYAMLFLPSVVFSNRVEVGGPLLSPGDTFYTFPYVGVQFGYMF